MYNANAFVVYIHFETKHAQHKSMRKIRKGTPSGEMENAETHR